LHLDYITAKAASPLFWNAPARGSLDAVVGETKARNISDRAEPSSIAGARPGSRRGSGTVPNANYFTAIAPMADPVSPMVLRLKELAAR